MFLSEKKRVFEVSWQIWVANPLSPVIPQVCALAVGTWRLCAHREPCREVFTPGEPSLLMESCQGNLLLGRKEGAGVLDHHMKCLLCSCAVSLAHSLLASPTCPFFFFPSSWTDRGEAAAPFCPCSLPVWLTLCPGHRRILKYEFCKAHIMLKEGGYSGKMLWSVGGLLWLG